MSRFITVLVLGPEILHVVATLRYEAHLAFGLELIRLHVCFDVWLTFGSADAQNDVYVTLALVPLQHQADLGVGHLERARWSLVSYYGFHVEVENHVGAELVVGLLVTVLY